VIVVVAKYALLTLDVSFSGFGAFNEYARLMTGKLLVSTNAAPICSSLITSEMNFSYSTSLVTQNITELFLRIFNNINVQKTLNVDHYKLQK